MTTTVNKKLRLATDLMKCEVLNVSLKIVKTNVFSYGICCYEKKINQVHHSSSSPYIPCVNLTVSNRSSKTHMFHYLCILDGQIFESLL